MKNKGKYIIICLILGIFLFIINTLNDAGEFKSIVPHFDGECIQIPGVSGAEDILFLNNGMAIISCDNRRKTLARFSVQGSLYAYDINKDLINVYKNIQNNRNELYDYFWFYKNKGNLLKSMKYFNKLQIKCMTSFENKLCDEKVKFDINKKSII